MDRPSRSETFSGSWVVRWIGMAQQSKLDEVKSLSYHGSALSEALSRREKCRCTCLARCHQLYRLPNFIVNASPFEIAVKYHHHHATLSPHSFRKLNRMPGADM